jgi:hypothetical protein
MRLGLAIICLFMGETVQAGALFDMAKSVTDVAGMRHLASAVFPPGYPDTADVSSFCQGVFEPPGFYFLTISLKSGPLYEEAFIFQGTRDSLRLRAHLPARFGVWRQAEWIDGRLIISEQSHSGIDMTSPEAERRWIPVMELLP